MFILSEAEIGGHPLKTISYIDINFFYEHNDVLNIFNLEHAFDENIIPLITSVLECQPNLFYRKTYLGLDNHYVINYLVKDLNKEMITKFQVDKEGYFPSFFLDIEALNPNNHNNPNNPNNSNNPNKSTTTENTGSCARFYKQSRKLLSSMCYENSKELVRVYARDLTAEGERAHGWNVQDTFSHKVETIISWPISSWCAFELCISTKSKCAWHLKIDVIEDAHFIDSKVDQVNMALEKIHKIIHSKEEPIN